MQNIDKKYWSGYLNADDDPILIQPNEYINLQDFRFGSATTGFVGDLESIGSNVLIPNDFLPSGQSYMIGKAEDVANRRIVFFLWNSDGEHGVYCYDADTDAIYAVILNSQVSGGLNFDKYHPIHSAFILNGCVYWVNDKVAQPRRADILAGIKMNQPAFVTDVAPYVAPMNQAVISWIRREPGLPVTIVKVTQTTPVVVANFIANAAVQFAWRYQYRNYELSTLSAWSTTANFNAPGDLFNRIDVTFPFAEMIDQDVIQIDLVVKFLVADESFIINSWQTSITADAAAIAAHNAGTTALSYSFYNDKIGLALDSTYAAKEFDAVPIYAASCEGAKNRGFMANVTSGYNTPKTTSLQAVAIQGSSASTTVTGTWTYLKWKSVLASNPSGPSSEMSLYLLDIQDIPTANNPGFYQIVGSTFPPLPPTVEWSFGIFQGAGIFDVMNRYAPSPTWINTIEVFDNSLGTAIVGGAPTIPELVNKVAFKTGETIRLGVEFMDNYGRRTGIVTNNTIQVTISERFYSMTEYVKEIDWTLSNANAPAEIPVEAYYYSINITRCNYTRFFQQFRPISTFYVTKDPTTGENIYTTTAYAANLNGIALDISTLDSFGQGYIFTEGDLVKLYMSAGGFFNLSITGQDGKWLLLQLADVGTVGAGTSLVEIYTPYKPSTDEPFYEVSELFPISFPGTASRQYSVIAGSLTGDITLINRSTGSTNYLAESMSPSDTFYKFWFTDAGRPSFLDFIGQTDRPVTIPWSNTFVAGSKVNGLSTFDALDTKDMSPDYARISKIILTSKIEMTGSVMLAICPTETAALYLGENIITTTTGQQQITQTGEVIGYINNLKGAFGTINPESVMMYKGNVYWFDLLNGKYIQYSDAGLFPISNYKMTRFWKLFAEHYQSLTAPEIEALGSRPFVFTGIDPHFGEIFVSVPAVLSQPPNGMVPSEDNIPYPWDIFDGAAKTIVYKLIADPNHWQGAYSFTAEGFGRVDDEVFSWKNGNMWKHNSEDSYSNFYGVAYNPKVMFVSNQNPTKPKVYNNVSVQANLAPETTLMETIYPYTQVTDLIQDDYDSAIEGVWYAQILRDRLTPEFAGDYDGGLLLGDVMRATYMYVMHTFESDVFVQLKFSNVSNAISYGHVTQ